MSQKNLLNLSPLGRRLLDRRSFIGQAGATMGSIPLLQLLAQEQLLADPKESESETSGSNEHGSIRPKIDPNNPYASRKPHHKPKATRMLMIYCPGAVSHIDTFDYKPALEKLHGTKPPNLPKVSFSGPTGNVSKSPWKFKPRGKTGKMVSDLLPHLAGMTDDLCFFHALNTKTSAHPQGENFFLTGMTMEGFPSIGSWTTYALGTENQELPSFVAISDPRGKPRSGKNNWGSGFLPAAFQGTDFSVATPPSNLKRPKSISSEQDKRAVDLLKRFNDQHFQKNPGDADLAARIASYELAGKMQMTIPEVTNIANEPKHVLKSYGADSKNQTKSDYAKNCILARRLIEKGVRVVQLFNGSDAAGGNGITNWDSHNDLKKTHEMQAEIMDQPTAALLQDLKQRGLLEETLVVWCTEFGRMPFLQSNGTGRDHNPGAFTCFMMGAGVKSGFTYGQSDEFGFKALENPTSVYDFNATILHLLGLNHERLTYFYNGLERRLTFVHGEVIQDILA